MSSPQVQQQRRIRLAPLPLSALPSHPALAERPRQNGESNNNNSNNQNQNQNGNNNGNNNTATTRPPLAAFIKQALDEAHTLLSDTIPLTFRVDKKLRSSPPSNAKVQLSSRVIPVSTEISPSVKGEKRKIKDDEEYWVCRKSIHVDAPEEGTASWKEFENGLRFDHSQHEMEYTPSVSSVETLLEWKDVDLGQQESGAGWRGVDMHGSFLSTYHYPKTLSSKVGSACEYNSILTSDQ